MENKNLLHHLFLEAEAYSSLEAIEELLQQGMELTQHPIQPLYICLKSMAPELAGTYLDRFSVEQRQVMLDLDLWQKDQVTPQNFNYWISAYSSCPNEEVRLSFIKSEQFLLWLKGRVNIWTFDVEDPEYPDHDNYFLTDDGLLLIEFDEDFPYVDELRMFIRELYGELGVEKAYAFLFKMVSDSFSMFEEEEYRIKKARMSDYGFVDYYDALAMTSVFQKIELVDNYIKKIAPVTGKIDELAQSQVLHLNALSPYKAKMDSFFSEIELISDVGRKRFLNFDFIRLVNATITLDNALQAGPVALSKTGRKSNSVLQLGFSYVRQMVGSSLVEGIFSRFLFTDLYKIGASLIYIAQKQLKRELGQYGFVDQHEPFLGATFVELIENSFETCPKCLHNGEWLEVETYDAWKTWQASVEQLVRVLPFIKQIHRIFLELRQKGQLLNPFYLNYQIEEMDFESIIITQFSRQLVGGENAGQMKLGLTIQEVRDLFRSVLDDRGLLRTDAAFMDHIKRFVTNTGMDAVSEIERYLYQILKNHLEGHHQEEMSDRDFTHVGGVIILDTIKQ